MGVGGRCDYMWGMRINVGGGGGGECLICLFKIILSTRDRTNIRAVQLITANSCCAPA